VAARPCSRRGAGERGIMEHARASWSHGDAIPVPVSAGGGVEGGRWRGGGSGFSGGRGGMGFTLISIKERNNLARVGRGASRGGEEALGHWN
jgi:hypothetical protein